MLKKLYPIILLTVIVLDSAVLLNYTNSITAPVIAEQGNTQVIEALERIFPDMTGYEVQNDIFVIDQDGNTIGYGFQATGSGYGGDINVVVGLADTTTIKGIEVVSQSETPGLGTRVAEEPFMSQFAGVAVEDVTIGGAVDAISGSTISSTAVVEAVRTTALEKIAALGQ